MNKEKTIKIIVLVIVLLAAIFLVTKIAPGARQEVSTDKPAFIVLNLYESWLEARLSTSTDPYAEGLHKSPILGKEVKTRLADLEETLGDDIDPVLCQYSLPEDGLSTRVVYQNEESAQIVVLSTEPGVYAQSIATLTKLDEGWYISDIKCSAGEVAPDREFTFEQYGILHTEVPEPWTSGSWHIIFVDDSGLGIVPLFFDANSTCISGGSESVCDPNTFTAETKVTVYGDMSEYGATVKKMEIEG